MVQPARWDQTLPPVLCSTTEPAHGSRSSRENQVAFPLPLLSSLDLPLETSTLVCFSLLPQVRRYLKQRYGTSPFNDEEEIKALLPAGRGGPSRTEGALQGLVPRARDIRSTTPFLLRVKRTFSCIPACLK